MPSYEVSEPWGDRCGECSQGTVDLMLDPSLGRIAEITVADCGRHTVIQSERAGFGARARSL